MTAPPTHTHSTAHNILHAQHSQNNNSLWVSVCVLMKSHGLPDDELACCLRAHDDDCFFLPFLMPGTSSGLYATITSSGSGLLVPDFLSCPQLNEIRASKGEGAESSEPLKPLVEVLREAKEKKEQEFADRWKTMKTGVDMSHTHTHLAASLPCGDWCGVVWWGGACCCPPSCWCPWCCVHCVAGKNRPLDEDELQFLDEMAQAEASRARQQVEQERSELEEFRWGETEGAGGHR